MKEVNYGTQLVLNNKQKIYFMTLSQDKKMASEIIHEREHCFNVNFLKFQTKHFCNVNHCRK